MQKHALIVEDDADGRGALRELLTLWDYRVTEAADPMQALALASTQQPDVVVIDLVQGADTLHLIERIKADHRRAFVVVFTGWAHLREAACAVGADGYVVKPDIDALQRLLDPAVAQTSEVPEVPETKEEEKKGRGR